MKFELLHEAHEQRTFVLIFETDDEVMSQLRRFAADEKLKASHFTAIGACREVTLGYFDWQTKTYKHNPVREQVEVVSLIGDVAEQESGERKVHAHVVLGQADGSALGGHLLEARVRPTLELVLVEVPAHLVRRHDATSGLALIRI